MSEYELNIPSQPQEVSASTQAAASSQRGENAAAGSTQEANRKKGSTTCPRVGVVAIGRNEGNRLIRCLESVVGNVAAVVYVDSDSTDASVSRAKALGAEVVELDVSIPFTAARARNEGFARLQQILPNVNYVQMIDGDCEVVKGWLQVAAAALDGDEKLGVVCGRRRERYPSASIYNGLTDMEWDTPVGPARSCGGDAMFRAAALTHVGGYDPTVIAGEEPELCVRLRGANWKVQRLDAEMTLHDADMHHFGQWWKRNVRAGHAYAQGAAMHGAPPEKHNVKQVKSIVLWGVALPATIVLLTLLSVVFSPFGLLAFLLSLGYLLLGFKVWRYRTKHGDPSQASAIYACFTILSKFPNALGAMTYWKNHALGKQAKIIEYKSAEGASA